jgi:hypothetical protein
MTRRRLIQRVLLILGIKPVGLFGCVPRQAGNRTFQPVGAAGDQPVETKRLSPAEMEDLLAFGEVLVEGRPLTPSERRYLADYIAERTTSAPWYLSLYRTTVGTLERLAGRRFASVGLPERVELISRYRLAVAQVRSSEDLGPLREEIRLLRRRAVPDLIRGYYSSPVGWAVVGYQSFPGRCGDLTRYTSSEA